MSMRSDVKRVVLWRLNVSLALSRDTILTALEYQSIDVCWYHSLGSYTMNRHISVSTNSGSTAS